MQSLDALRWDDLRLFLALYREGSLKRAATVMGVNVSTMSRRLDGLEEACGAHLFDRTPEGTLPTAAAEQLVIFTESMEQAAVGFSRQLEELEVEPAGEVRLTCAPGVTDHFIAPALGDLAARYPKLRLTIISTIGYADLTRREADLALRLTRPGAGDFVATRVAKQGWTALASPKLAASLGTVKDAAALPWVTWTDALAHLPDRRWVDSQVPEERRVLLTDSMTAQIEAVRAGLGAMVTPTVYRELRGLEELCLAPALRRSLDALPESAMWLVGHRALRDVPRIAAVWSWLIDRFATYPLT